jgi:hypothetical protein
VSLVVEVEQRYLIKFLLDEGMKEVEIINWMNKQYDRHALQRMQVYCWIKEMKSDRKNLSDMRPPRRTPDEGLDDCIGRTLKEDPHLSTGKITLD